MMVEVGFSQSLPDLHRTTALYFGSQTTIQIVDIITNTSIIALIAALYLHTSTTPLIPTSIISFGTAEPNTSTINYIINKMGVPLGSFIGVGRPDPNNNNNNFSPCNAANLPDYQMNIPGLELFNGVPVNRLPVGFPIAPNTSPIGFLVLIWIFGKFKFAARTLDSPSNAQYTLDKPPSPTSFMSEFYQMVSSLESAYRNFDARHTS
ncbi:hypothetical protein GLOIN_2v1472046 [Rhizophagus irregularis DAOM 181602=DAOM 197198]|uniref:Uncharacterized protein n=1 Tax=Rhizophagus irregularis (strain DAOM 181602 / DAOM 197198 / MUCL 43194) TaxID=747089 RepID=U9U7F6_RHIID|nr:hypothetical protein GLOIN_2v1472046 [Rhizophagus irregularis DAOM 181602=DAOM 197198]